MEHQSDVVVVDVDVDVDVVVVDDDDYDDGNPTPPYFRSAPKGILPPKKKHINNQVSGAQNLCRPQIYWLAEGRVPILEMFTITMKPSSISNSVSA